VFDIKVYFLIDQKLTNLIKPQCLSVLQHFTNDLHTELSTAIVDNSKANNAINVLRTTGQNLL